MASIINELPYVLFSCDYPTYPHKMFACRDIGWKHPSFVFNGSAIFLSGGLLRESPEGASVLALGLIEDEKDVLGRHFTELLANQLVQDDDRVIIYYDRHWTHFKSWPEAARNAGFDVAETSDVAICTGNKSNLVRLDWLDGSLSGCETHLFTARGIPGYLETSLMECARIGNSPSKLMGNFWDMIYQRPDEGIRQLGEYSIFTTFGGIEDRDIVINRRATELDDLSVIVQKIAQELKAVVYDAGSLSKLDSQGYFSSWARGWYEVPDNWKRIG